MVALGLRKPFRARRLGEIAAWTGILFALLPVLLAGAGGHLAGLAGVLVFALVPLFTVFIIGRSDGDAMRLLMPAVLAVGGLALVIPFAWPSSAAGIGWLGALLALAVLVAIAGIRLHGLMQDVPLVWSAAAASGASALVAGVGWRTLEYGPIDWTARQVGIELAWGLAVDGPLLILTMWLLRQMRPMAFSSRYVWIPLVTIFGGLVVTRSPVGWEGWLGLILACGASLSLVMAKEPDEPALRSGIPRKTG